MKIRLSEDEVYEIKMPEEIGLQDFESIVFKFNFLLKNFAKFNIIEKVSDEIVLSGDVAKTYKKQDKEKWNTLRDNRDIFVELLNTHYNKSTEEFYKTLEKYNLDFKKQDMCNTKIIRLRELHKIKPEEVGLIKFPGI